MLSAESPADHGLERFENLDQAGEFMNLRNGNNGIYICCAGEHFAVAAMFQPWVYFTVDLRTGEARIIECLQQDFEYTDAGTGWVAVGAYDTGFLYYDLNYGFWPLLAVDPETLNFVYVNLTGTNCPQPTVRTLVGMISNGRYFCPRSDIINGYFIAE